MNRPDTPRAGTRPTDATDARPDVPPGESRTRSPDDEPVFAEPWQAQAFGLVTSLHERGLFTWPEWAAALATELEGQAPSLTGEDYYRCWLAALERLLAEREVVPTAELDRTTEAWQRAAHATPHGEPIRLENDPRAPVSR